MKATYLILALFFAQGIQTRPGYASRFDRFGRPA
jgi:hypothetical protein